MMKRNDSEFSGSVTQSSTSESKKERTMVLNVRNANDVTVVSVAKELVGTEGARLREVVHGLTLSAKSPGRLIVDLNKTERVDTLGLSALMSLAHIAGDGSAVLVSSNPYISEILRIVRIGGIVNRFASEPDAVKWIDRVRPVSKAPSHRQAVTEVAAG